MTVQLEMTSTVAIVAVICLTIAVSLIIRKLRTSK
jgi:hypothetical protein